LSKARTKSPIAILVLGMHRSGTSAMTAALQALGASLGDTLVAANEDNPGGYFENAAAVTAHETLLAELDRGWDDVRELPEGWQQSPAGRQAAQEIAGLLKDEFAGVPLWALKDPRLCRLLPLWQPRLAKAGIEARYLFVVRHPDEVAASLGKRDGIGSDQAHVLWLRHFLDAERDTRGKPRCLVTFDALLADPVASLRHIGAALAIKWPRPPDAEGLSQLLDPGQRHHRPGAERSEAGPRMAALDVYGEAIAGTWPDGDAQRAVLQDWTRGLAPWLDHSGNALARVRRDGLRALQRYQIADAALQQVTTLSLSRLDDVQALAARLASTDAALEEAKALSRSRLGEAKALNARLELTDAALDETKALSLARLGEVRALNARLELTDGALDEAKSLSLSRLDEVKALNARLELTDGALDEAKALSRSHLDEVKALSARLELTDAALDEATALSRSHLDEVKALNARLELTDAALDEAKALSLSRLDEVKALNARLELTDGALDEAKVLSLSRLEEVKALDTRLELTEVALGQAKTLALSRQEEVVSLAARLAATDAALAAVETLSLSRLDELHALDARLQATDAALEDTKSLALSRLAALMAAQARHARSEAALGEAAALSEQRMQDMRMLQAQTDEQIQALASRASTSEADLQAVLESRSWRMTRPLRWLTGLLGSGPAVR